MTRDDRDFKSGRMRNVGIVEVLGLSPAGKGFHSGVKRERVVCHNQSGKKGGRRGGIAWKDDVSGTRMSEVGLWSIPKYYNLVSVDHDAISDHKDMLILEKVVLLLVKRLQHESTLVHKVR